MFVNKRRRMTRNRRQSKRLISKANLIRLSSTVRCRSGPRQTTSLLSHISRLYGTETGSRDGTDSHLESAAHQEIDEHGQTQSAIRFLTARLQSRRLSRLPRDSS